jgi:lipoyl(octanoyl) transferase
VHALQKRLVEARGAGKIGDVVLLVEHEPVITLGRSADAGNVLLSAEALSARGVDRVETGRGGDVTYHGPGQLVCYPILDLSGRGADPPVTMGNPERVPQTPPDRRDVRRYVRCLAEAMILIAREHGVEAGVVDGLVGIWVDAHRPSEWAGVEWAREIRKLGAIGVRLSRWITMHGFALNLTVDLGAFGLIVPCGIREHGVTSIEALTGRRPAIRDVALSCPPLLAAALEITLGPAEDLAEITDLDAALVG